MHQNRASPFASDFRRRLGHRRENSAVGIKFVPFNRRENRCSLAIFFAEQMAHLGALNIARFCGGAVKIAAATAENRAILVHSEPHTRGRDWNYQARMKLSSENETFTHSSENEFIFQDLGP